MLILLDNRLASPRGTRTSSVEELNHKERTDDDIPYLVVDGMGR